MSAGKGPYGTVYDDVPHKMPTFVSFCDEGDGELHIQWRNGDKHLSVYIPDASIWWLKSQGTVMEDRDENPTNLADAYRWLMTPEEPEGEA